MTFGLLMLEENSAFSGAQQAKCWQSLEEEEKEVEKKEEEEESHPNKE